LKATSFGGTKQPGGLTAAGRVARRAESKPLGKQVSNATPSPKFIVAFSGGLDSTVLLHLCALFFGPESVLAVHVNHGLQAAAKSFETQARRTCREWGIRLTLKRLNGSPAKGESIEAWARHARYQVLAAVARKHGIEHVFTAHHQDDQIETLLIALSRGAGLEGLRGIAPNRLLGQDPGDGSPLLHRPLLECSRGALKLYAEANDLHWVEDPSNQDPRFLRNRIRLQLMPALQSTLPSFAQQASRSMAHLRQAAGRLELQLGAKPAPSSQAAILERPPRPPHGQSAARKISRSALLAMAEAEQVATLRAWLRELGLKLPSQAKLSEIRKQLLESRGGSVSVLHDGRTLRRERDRLWVEEGGRGDERPSSSAAVTGARIDTRPSTNVGPKRHESPSQLSVEQTSQGWIWPLPEFRGSLVIKARPKPGVGESKARQLAMLQLSALQLSALQLSALQVAAPRSTQKMQLEANTPRKTLKNLFQASGIRAELRKRLPCVSQGEEVLFVAGLGTAPSSPWKFEFLPDL
jgi:tRNA(Ile)-lysidine synthase